MDMGLYMGVAAMRSSERHMDAITANLANASTAAYKRQGAVTHSFDLGKGDRKHREITTTTQTDFSQGVLERRDDPYSLALDGDGFFAVETPTGEAYTRNGSFHVDEQGELLTTEGFPVAWTGSRGRVQPTGEPVVIDGVGKITQGSNPLGQLKITAFADNQHLLVDAQGYYRATPTLEAKTPEAIVHQGAMERSNAESVDELVSLIKAQRSFESAANMMKSIDQSYKRLNQSH